MRQVVAGTLLVSTGVALLWVFLKIYLEGIVYIVEPRNWVLAVEIVMSVAIILYGCVRAFNALKKARG